MKNYKRNILDKDFRKRKRQISKETSNYHTDNYTGKELKPGGKWDYEHIISAKRLSSIFGSFLSDDKLSKVVNNRDNIATIDRKINQSKNKHSLIGWMFKKSNGRQIRNSEFYGIDILRTTESLMKANTGVIQSLFK